MLNTEGMTEREKALLLLSSQGAVMMYRKGGNATIHCGQWSLLVSAATVRGLDKDKLISKQITHYAASLSKKGRLVADRRRAEREKAQ